MVTNKIKSLQLHEKIKRHGKIEIILLSGKLKQTCQASGRISYVKFVKGRHECSPTLKSEHSIESKAKSTSTHLDIIVRPC